MKRFTDTDKWRDPWFRRLTSPAKQLWGYICDNCDAIGMIELDLDLVSVDCGQKITSTHIEELGDRLQTVAANRYFVHKFINFQYGELTSSCPPHRYVIKLAEKHKLVRVGLGYAYPKPTLSSQVVENEHNPYPSGRVALPFRTRQDKTRQDKDQDQGGTGGNDVTTTLFDVFWASYPKKKSKGDAEKAWKQVSAESSIEIILQAIEFQKQSHDWNKDSGQYIPYPATWLRSKGWLNQENTNSSPEEFGIPSASRFRIYSSQGYIYWTRADGGPRREQFGTGEDQEKTFKATRQAYDLWLTQKP